MELYLPSFGHRRLECTRFYQISENKKRYSPFFAIGVMPAGMAMLILGAVMTRIAQQYDISLVFSNIGLPFLGMVVLILATWTTNTTNAYSAGLNAVMVFNLKESGRSMATVILGAVGTVLAAVGVAGNLRDFLHFLKCVYADHCSVYCGILEPWERKSRELYIT